MVRFRRKPEYADALLWTGENTDEMMVFVERGVSWNQGKLLRKTIEENRRGTDSICFWFEHGRWRGTGMPDEYLSPGDWAFWRNGHLFFMTDEALRLNFEEAPEDDS